MYWTYSRQSLLNLKNLRFTAALDYNAKKWIKYLEINRKFQFKRINGRKYGAKSLHRQWDTNSGVHWEVLIPISLSLQSILPKYLSAFLNVRSLSSNLLQIQHLLEILDIFSKTEQYFLLLNKLLPDSVMASSRSEENVVLNNFQHKSVSVLVYPNDFIWAY